ERIIAAAHGYERATTRVPPQVRLAATDLLAGKARIFAGKDICLEAVLASACLPTLHHTVTIDGRRYWDGGFTVNPELLGLIEHRAAAPDTLLIELSNPRQRADLGHESARLIAEETARLTFTQPLQRELAEISRHRAVHAGLSALGRLSLAPDTTARLCARHRLHGIDAAAHTRALEPGSKLRPTTENIARLFDAGRFEAISWLENHGSGVGVRETFNWPSQTPDEGAP
ncbi:MAG: patatin-like phospholipase family protein, partial [Pseudomonadota bacterium]